MKNITLSAEESLIEQARMVARGAVHDTERGFSGGLERYVTQSGGAAAVDALMSKLRHVRSSGPYGRDAMNER